VGAGRPSADLDELIGDIRREAARRRAAPDFPLDDEARLSSVMDGEGPVGQGADLAALAAALRQMSGPADPSGRVAGLAAAAVAAVAARLSHLEQRRPIAGRPGPAPAGDLPDLTGWLDEWGIGSRGRVLIAGEGAGAWADRVGDAAYAIDPTGEQYADAGVTRTGPVLEHLRSVADRALSFVILVGGLAEADVQHLDRWATELARTTAAVRVAAEAPWAWRRRIGEVAADRAARRPLHPDTWLETLARAGFSVTGRYGADGRHYGVEADGRS
jgi:hypothetical protein